MPARLLLALVFSSFTPALLHAQTGRVYDRLTLPSAILGGERAFAVYLPPGYDTSERSYPILYLLHGSGDDQTGWVQFGEVQHIADAAIGDGSATAMIIVMPDADTGQRGYFNSLDGAWRYEDFFFDELMPHVEGRYRVKSDKRYRAVAGLSMGGGGSFMYALHRPDLFSSAAPLSAYVGPLTMEAMMARLPESARALPAAQREAYFERHNAVRLVENLPDEQKNAVRWYIDCGDDDFLYEGNALVHIAMRKAGVPHEYRVRDGGHTWTYWRESLPDVLAFVSQGFRQY